MLTATDVEKTYQRKCSKYTPEQLTDKLKALLFYEAAEEISMMNFINSGGKIAGYFEP